MGIKIGRNFWPEKSFPKSDQCTYLWAFKTLRAYAQFKRKIWKFVRGKQARLFSPIFETKTKVTLRSCNFSWFYKIPHLLKWLNLPFIIYRLLYWGYQSQNVFGKTKVYLLWETKMFLMGNQKWHQKFEFEKLKIPNLDILAILGDFQFFKFNFFVIFGFPLKK